MKYKLVLYNNGDQASTDFAGNFEFYVYEEARLCGTRWRDIQALNRAVLWNGEAWELL